MDIANAVLQTSPLGQYWVELFHSTSLWPDTLITFRTPTSPIPVTRRLLDASSIRQGFRVFRFQLLPPTIPPPLPCPPSATVPTPSPSPPSAPPPLRFRLRPPEQLSLVANTPGAATTHELPSHAASRSGGRFVVADCVRHVGDPDVAACLRACRPDDVHVELGVRLPASSTHHTPICVWTLVATDGEGPGDLLERAKEANSDTAIAETDRYQGKGGTILEMRRITVQQVGTHTVSKERSELSFARFEAPYGAVCKVLRTCPNDPLDCGDKVAMGELLLVPLPGRYSVEDDIVSYLGPAELDQLLYGT